LSTASETLTMDSDDSDLGGQYHEDNSVNLSKRKFDQNSPFKKIHSSPNFTTLQKPNNCSVLKTQRVTSSLCLSTMSPILATKNTPRVIYIDAYAETDPFQFMKTIIEQNGYQMKVFPSLIVENYFQKITDEQIDGYDNNITNAVRCENLEELRKMRDSGKIMQCCNRFGESIMHMACRRRSIKVVQFLLEDCDSSVRLRDDFGRTPLHDACWTTDTEFEIVKMLLTKDPDLLLFSDKRGHTPLHYTRKDSWGNWCRFLSEHRDLLQPKALLQKKVLKS